LLSLSIFSAPFPFGSTFTRHSSTADWNSIIDTHGFRDRFRFEHDFQTSSWDEIEQVHHITFNTPAGPVVIEAEILIAASGALNKPIIPSLPGVDSFEGEQWHSSRWNTEVDLSHKRVAVVGNGSSGIQAVPYIAGLEGIQLTQFTRSPGYWKPKVSYRRASFSHRSPFGLREAQKETSFAVRQADCFSAGQLPILVASALHLQIRPLRQPPLPMAPLLLLRPHRRFEGNWQVVD
jgi:cation diffusion facilitator CzcD-associated flavoprotein CzcO